MLNTKYWLAPLVAVALLAGCSLLKTERKDIPPPPPKMDYEDVEIVREQSSINAQLAEKINAEGAQANSIATITLRNGTRIVLDYVGHPYADKDVAKLTPKEIAKIAAKAEGIVADHNEDLAKHDQKMGERREDLIKETNLKWAWGRILALFGSTWFLAIVGVPILCAFFPIIIPFVQIAWQLLSAGVGAVGVVAKFGISGLTKTIKAVETWRDQHKGTDVGVAFDTHMKKTLDEKDVAGLDKLKNYFKI